VLTDVSFGDIADFPLYTGFSDVPSIVPILGQLDFSTEVIELKFAKPNPGSFLQEYH
jgi:hypothetical protein